MQTGLELLSTPQGDLATRLGIDLVSVLVLIRVIYYRTYRRTDLFLTFFSFNLVIFLIAFVLNSTEMSMGAAFGLFAVFSMLRYRTQGISATDMTYLFLGIALGLMLAVSSAAPLGLALVGLIVLVSTFLLESNWLVKREVRQEVVYDNIDLVNAHAREELLHDLRLRTGLNVRRVEVDEIDLVKDSAKLIVYYHVHDALAPRPTAPYTELGR
jgi:predicted membrane metal-binding protein